MYMYTHTYNDRRLNLHELHKVRTVFQLFNHTFCLILSVQIITKTVEVKYVYIVTLDALTLELLE